MEPVWFCRLKLCAELLHGKQLIHTAPLPDIDSKYPLLNSLYIHATKLECLPNTTYWGDTTRLTSYAKAPCQRHHPFLVVQHRLPSFAKTAPRAWQQRGATGYNLNQNHNTIEDSWSPKTRESHRNTVWISRANTHPKNSTLRVFFEPTTKWSTLFLRTIEQKGFIHISWQSYDCSLTLITYTRNHSLVCRFWSHCHVANLEFNIWPPATQ